MMKPFRSCPELPYLALERVRSEVRDDDEAAVVAHVHVVRVGHLEKEKKLYWIKGGRKEL